MGELKPAIKEGIYFNLSNEDYHNDPALSHSGMKDLLVSWQDYWERSVHNPQRGEYKATDPMKLGERTGMYLLEPKRFNDEFNTVKNYNAKGKGICLSTIEMAKIVDAVECVTRVPIGKEHFSDGYPEVSIFWRDIDTGIMLRAKIDYLRTFGAIDFKRIMAMDNWTIGKAVKSQALDIQQFLYLEGIKAARMWLKALTDDARRIFAKSQGVDYDWLVEFMLDTDLLFRFLFQRSTPPYIWQFKELEPEVAVEGANAVSAALRRYAKCSKQWGFKKPQMGTANISTISQFHVPRRDYDYEN